MKNVKKVAEARGHNSQEMTKHYVNSSPENGETEPEVAQPTSRKPPFKLEDCTKYVYGRDFPAIVSAWTTFANIDWLTSKNKDDFELIRANGAEALKRLMPVALRDTNQSRHVAGFLLSLYNWERFHFDLCDLRCIDHFLFLDCITVLMMNVVPGPEIHEYFEHGNKVFEGIAKAHKLRDYTKYTDAKHNFT
ncbi:hypothetical protein os4_23320 [Comamonadaceae bacterium OS-4]|nr:hypothetical protein os4_23320 [Comamonadaceae bacterium OS-4]